MVGKEAEKKNTKKEGLKKIQANGHLARYERERSQARRNMTVHPKKIVELILFAV